MITDDNNRSHYPAVKSLPTLRRGITSNHRGDFYCLNCFHSYTAHNRLKKHERVCNNHFYCGLVNSKKCVIYVKKSFVMIKARKKSEIAAITSENIEELLIAYPI